MRRLRTIIVDDERLARVNLKKLLEPHPIVDVVGEAHSCQSAIDIIEKCQPELVFLDIQLRGETGFDLLDVLNTSIKIIFVTAFDEYAVRAFQVNATDYLLKPVSPERLKLSLDRLTSPELETKVSQKSYDYSDSIYVHLTNSTSRFIKLSTIAYIEPVGNYSRLITLDSKRYLVLRTLKQWQEDLPEKYFIRIHRSYIINIDHVDRVEENVKDQHMVYLKNFTTPLEASRRLAWQLKSHN